MIQIRQLGTIIAGMVLMTVFPCVYGQSRADLDKIAASQVCLFGGRRSFISFLLP